MTVLLFLAVLFVLILVHEWGHYITAKKTGMQVDEFGIGFPPKVYGKKIGETEYTLNALPIGGFVRIAGENAEDIATGESDNPRSFVHKSKWAQALVLIAGVAMNVIFAWLIYVIIFMVGVPTVTEESAAPAGTPLTIVALAPNSPAAEAGVPVGATITGVSAGSSTLATLAPAPFQTFIAEHARSSIELTFQQADDTQTVSVTPATGIVPDAPERPVIGVSVGFLVTESLGLFAAIRKASTNTIEMLGAVTVGLWTLLSQAVVGEGDLSQVAGPVGIAGMVGDAAAIGFTSLLLFTAFISLNLAVINMLPFPALDGGRLVMVAIEAVTRRPINPAWVLRVNTVGIILLLGLMVLVTVNDILRLVG
ncbi:MAG TPA: site-2 protease family protein [Candidatus Paceibacterota bacterium]|nr:site-2 protease family protein [Candidatus Paceibacterota bacterium]